MEIARNFPSKQRTTYHKNHPYDLEMFHYHINHHPQTSMFLMEPNHRRTTWNFASEDYASQLLCQQLYIIVIYSLI